ALDGGQGVCALRTCLCKQHSAIYDHALTRHVSGEWRGEKDEGVRDLFGRRIPPQRYALDVLSHNRIDSAAGERRLLTRQPGHHVSVYQTRADAVDQHTVRSKFLCHRLSQPDQRELARRVCTIEGSAAQSRDGRGDKHAAALALGNEAATEYLKTAVDAGKVDLERPLPGCLVEVQHPPLDQDA